LLWSKNTFRIGISTNEEIENVDKYKKVDQSILKTKIHNNQIHQDKQTCQGKKQPICRFQYSNHQ
jgi:hypothetical protein